MGIGRLQPQEHPEILHLPPSLIGSTHKKASTQSRGNPPEITVAGHVSMNQESFVQSSQTILQGLSEGGYICTKTLKLQCFFGDEKKNKLDFDMWER